MFGNSFPHADGFGWNCVWWFRSIWPHFLQGFDSFDEPVGPAIECRLRAIPTNEGLALMRA